jgi:hypothetical protein
MSSAEHNITAVAVGIRIAQPERSVYEEEAGSQSAVSQFKSRGPHNRYLRESGIPLIKFSSLKNLKFGDFNFSIIFRI